MSIRKKTKQHTFNMAVNGLLDQGKRAAEDGFFGGCKYRWYGLKCAVGQLIPDKLYKRSFEGTTVDGPEPVNAVSKLMVKLGHDLNLCDKLQDAHDGADDFNEMCGKFIQLAEDEGLTLPKRLRL